LVKATSKGSIFHTCHRICREGRPFKGWKSRTMVENADVMEAELKSQNEMVGPAFKITNDPRATPICRFLRRYSIDELPQLWNVLKGISALSDRAPREHEYAQFTDFQRLKLTVQPGITCLWQVQGRHRINDYDQWVELDLEYIRTWSLWLDVKILARTALVVLQGTGA